MELGQRAFQSGGIAAVYLYPWAGFEVGPNDRYYYAGEALGFRPLPYTATLSIAEGRNADGLSYAIGLGLTLRLSETERAALRQRARRYVLLARTTSGLWCLAGEEYGLEVLTTQNWAARPGDGDGVPLRVQGAATDYYLGEQRPKLINRMLDATNDVAGRLNLTVVRGDTLELTMALRDDAGTLLDLTGDNFRLVVQDRQGADVADYALGTGLSIENSFDLVLTRTAAQTELLPQGHHRYRLIRTEAGGAVRTWLRGDFTVI